VASELNTAILKSEHQSSTAPKLYKLIKLILWAQDELSRAKVKYPTINQVSNIFDTSK
jgi:hypothetical protein